MSKIKYKLIFASLLLLASLINSGKAPLSLDPDGPQREIPAALEGMIDKFTL